MSAVTRSRGAVVIAPSAPLPIGAASQKKKAAPKRSTKKKGTVGRGKEEEVSEDNAGEEGKSGDVVIVPISPDATIQLMKNANARQEQMIRDLQDTVRQLTAKVSAVVTPGPSGVNSTTGSNHSSRAPAPRDAPKERYAGEGGLIDKLDAWVRSATRMLAFYEGISDKAAVAWLATGLDGAAGDWFDEEVHSTGQAPATPSLLFDGLRRRFQPVNSAETARRDLDVLRQSKGMSVNDYTTRFRQLITHLPSDSAETRMFQYRRGLLSHLEDKIAQAEPQPATLDKLIALAARIEGRAASQGRGSNDQAAGAETDSPPVIESTEQLNALLERTAAMAAEAAVRQHGYDSRRIRGSNKGSRDQPLWKLVGLTKEEGDRRRAANLCMHCAGTGHVYRDCKERAAKKPARLN